MTTPALRDFQRIAVTEVLGRLGGGTRSVCLVAPTGAGKTVMAAALVQEFVRRGLKVLFVAHRIELVEQAIARLGVPCGLIVAGSPSGLSLMPCVVASLQTLARREVPDVDVILVDEAHHIMSKSYQRVLEQRPEARLLGLTATPTRLDGKPLGDVFAAVVIAANVSSLIDQGYLVKPRVFTTPAGGPDVDGVKKTAGDFNADALELVCNTTTLRGDVVKHWQDRCPDRPSVCFAVSLQHSRDLVADFGAIGVRAVHVDGSMARPERDAALAAIRSGAARVLCNVGIVTEGWDFPELGVAILARPTASLSLLLQMVGRVMRPHPDKPDALVLDHAGNFVRHGVLPWTDIDWAARVSGKKKVQSMALKTCPACYSIMLSTARVCDCGYAFVSDKKSEPREVTTDRNAQLQEVTSVEAMMVESYLERRAQYNDEPIKPYTQKLIERVRAGAIRDDFKPYIVRARGSVGKAAGEYKKACGRWP